MSSDVNGGLMKLLSFVLMLTGLAFAADVTVIFDYDFTNGVKCSPTVTTNCYDHFEAGILNTTLVTMSSIALPAGNGVVTGITGGFTNNDHFGNQKVSVVMVAKDADGARITSDPNLCFVTVVLRPHKPVNLVVQ